MTSLFDYLDYRTFLRDFYDAQKKENPYFSYRYIGRKIGLDPGYVVKIMQGKLHVPEKYIDGFCSLCKFSAKEKKFFRTLIDFNKAKTEDRIKQLFEKLLACKSLGKHSLDEFQYDYYHKWYHTAVRSLIGIVPFSGDFAALAAMLTPQVTVPDVKKSVALLEKLSLIRKEPSGVYALTDQFVTTGESWRMVAIRDFQRETINLAAESLDRHKKEDRDISTVTVAIDKEKLGELRERISEFRESILKLAGDSATPDCVYQLNVQLFPMASSKAGGI